jgi:hypothetical protein
MSWGKGGVGVACDQMVGCDVVSVGERLLAEVAVGGCGLEVGPDLSVVG